MSVCSGRYRSRFAWLKLRVIWLLMLFGVADIFLLQELPFAMDRFVWRPVP